MKNPQLIDDSAPFVATPPGEMLGYELQVRGFSKQKFANLIGCSRQHLSDVVHGKHPITIEMALRIEAATGMKAHVWMNLQTTFDLQAARNDRAFSKVLKKIRMNATR